MHFSFDSPLRICNIMSIMNSSFNPTRLFPSAGRFFVQRVLPLSFLLLSANGLAAKGIDGANPDKAPAAKVIPVDTAISKQLHASAYAIKSGNMSYVEDMDQAIKALDLVDSSIQRTSATLVTRETMPAAKAQDDATVKRTRKGRMTAVEEQIPVIPQGMMVKNTPAKSDSVTKAVAQQKTGKTRAASKKNTVVARVKKATNKARKVLQDFSINVIGRHADGRSKLDTITNHLAVFDTVTNQYQTIQKYDTVHITKRHVMNIREREIYNNATRKFEVKRDTTHQYENTDFYAVLLTKLYTSRLHPREKAVALLTPEQMKSSQNNPLPRRQPDIQPQQSILNNNLGAEPAAQTTDATAGTNNVPQAVNSIEEWFAANNLDINALKAQWLSRKKAVRIPT